MRHTGCLRRPFSCLGLQPPPQAGARRKWLTELDASKATLILYESPKRVQRLLTELCEGLGEDRAAVVCRELTKKFEEVSRGSLGQLAADFADRQIRGEIVVLVGRRGAVDVDTQDVDAALREAMKTMRVKDAATAVAGAFGLPRRQVYQAALRLEDGS